MIQRQVEHRVSSRIEFPSGGAVDLQYRDSVPGMVRLDGVRRGLGVVLDLTVEEAHALSSEIERMARVAAGAQ
jgi:hypothetical protein